MDIPLARRIAALALTVAMGPAHAAFHLWQIDEIYSGADGTVQFVELTALAGGQQFLGGHTLASNSTAGSQLFTFPGNLPGDTTGRKFLAGTAGFAALGLVTPDYVLPNGFLRLADGQLVFAEGSDVVNYGALPTDGRSIDRAGVPGTATPTNFAGVTGAIAPAAGATRIADVRTTPALSQVSDPIVIGSAAYFVADDGVSGRELWKTDGTAAGTIRVKDLNPGPAHGIDLANAQLTKVGTSLYFAATDVLGLPFLWKSDGTEAGTLRLPARSPQALADVNGTLFLSAEQEGQELFRSDGSVAGTFRVADIHPFYAFPVPVCCGPQYYSSSPRGFVPLGGAVLFGANSGGAGRELWKTDGTETGTVQVRDIRAGSAGSDPDGFVVIGGAAYFTADDGAGALQLWRTDGTQAGTTRVATVLLGLPGSNPRLVAHGGTLFFAGADAPGGLELWKSDGTDVGTVRVKDINPGTGGSNPQRLASLNGALFFAADDGTSGVELWASDGTEAGTVRVKDIRAGASGSSPSRLTAMGGFVYFTADDGTGVSLWRTDGTEAGTTKVVTSFPALGFPDAGPFAVIGSAMYFAAADPAGGTELWKSDGTPGGTAMLKDINPGAGTVGFGGLVSVGGTAYFTADGGTDGAELWKSDGTSAGTAQVKDIAPGADGSYPRFLTPFEGKLLFSASGTGPFVGGDGFEVWASNGTAAGTTLVGVANRNTFIVNVFRNGVLSPFTVANRRAYFLGRDDLSLGGQLGGQELWTYDAATSTTARVKDINPAGNSDPHNMANVNGTVFFAADDGTSGVELWKSDGTVAGTVRVRDINPGASSSNPRNLVNVNGVVFFAADDGTSGVELWSSDGTEAGTVRVKDIAPGATNSSPSQLVNLGGVLIFSAYEPATGVELWRSDGTAAGTMLMKDIFAFIFSLPGGGFAVSSSDPDSLTVVGSAVYFSASTGNEGRELWKTDGTAAGTVMVKDINPAGSSSPRNLANVNGMLYFVANNGTHGDEPWKSDGTAAGTVLVHDVSPGPVGSDPQGFALAGSRVLFTAWDGGARRSLWGAQIDPGSIPRLANISTRGRVETGNDVMIGGFVIGGSTPKKVLITARGPSLAAFGVTGAMANPTLQLFSGQTVIASNDDWQTNANAADITATGIAPTNPLESALLTTLNPGAYTAIVSGVGGGTGVGIVEVFEQDRPDIPLINMSTRGQVQTGDNVMIGGFIIYGDAPKTVLITARGPSLAPFGITNPLANPSLQLFSGQTLIASNDDFGTAPNLASIQATGVAPTNALESAILITLNPGAYTAIVTGVGGGTGVGIVEVFAR